jgi:hypothetical protein
LWPYPYSKSERESSPPLIKIKLEFDLIVLEIKSESIFAHH